VGVIVSKREMEPHVPGNPLYVDADRRICVGCPKGQNILPLVHFQSRHWEEMCYSTMCMSCLKETKKINSGTHTTKVVNDLSKNLARASKRNVNGLSFERVMAEVCKSSGGAEAMFAKTGKVFASVLDAAADNPEATNAQLDRAVKVGEALLKHTATIEKNKAKEIDLSSMSEEEISDILMPLAIEQILNNQKFREELLKNSDVRAALFEEDGIEVLEVGGDE